MKQETFVASNLFRRRVTRLAARQGWLAAEEGWIERYIGEMEQYPIDQREAMRRFRERCNPNTYIIRQPDGRLEVTRTQYDAVSPKPNPAQIVRNPQVQAQMTRPIDTITHLVVGLCSTVAFSSSAVPVLEFDSCGRDATFFGLCSYRVTDTVRLCRHVFGIDVTPVQIGSYSRTPDPLVIELDLYRHLTS